MKKMCGQTNHIISFETFLFLIILWPKFIHHLHLEPRIVFQQQRGNTPKQVFVFAIIRKSVFQTKHHHICKNNNNQVFLQKRDYQPNEQHNQVFQTSISVSVSLANCLSLSPSYKLISNIKYNSNKYNNAYLRNPCTKRYKKSTHKYTQSLY